MFEKLQLKSSDIDQIFTVFVNTQDDDIPTIEIAEFFNNNSIPFIPFIVALFTIFDNTGSSSYDACTFENFILTLWNFLTLDHQELMSFIVMMYELVAKKDGDTSMFSRHEIRFIFESCWDTNNFKFKRFVVPEIDVIEYITYDSVDSTSKRFEGLNSCDLIYALNESFLLLDLVRQVQEMLCKKIVGQYFWRRLLKERLRNHGSKPIFKILDGLIDHNICILNFYRSLNSMISLPRSFNEALMQLKRRDNEIKQYRIGKQSASPKNRSRAMLSTDVIEGVQGDGKLRIGSHISLLTYCDEFHRKQRLSKILPKKKSIFSAFSYTTYFKVAPSNESTPRRYEGSNGDSFTRIKIDAKLTSLANTADDDGSFRRKNFSAVNSNNSSKSKLSSKASSNLRLITANSAQDTDSVLGDMVNERHSHYGDAKTPTSKNSFRL